MSFEIKELIISENDNIDKIIEIIKIILFSSEKVKLISSSNSSLNIAKASENLFHLEYVEYENNKTITEIEENNKIVKLNITLKKTNKLINLYEENEQNLKTKNRILGKIKVNEKKHSEKIISWKNNMINLYCDIYK